MPITSVTSDPQALTLTVVGDYPVSVERLWEAYSDPRQLERFWGPETWPAKFARHDFVVVKGTVEYLGAHHSVLQRIDTADRIADYLRHCAAIGVRPHAGPEADDAQRLDSTPSS